MQEWHSLLRSNNDESKCLRSAQRVGLKAIYTALLILTIEHLLLAINALPKPLLFPTETRILRLFGYLNNKRIRDVKQTTFDQPTSQCYFYPCIC
ncbi:MAG: hypothetical protein CMK65_10825 [Pseudoalteromonas sp.]|nr:hypothetical protein [Pseudoalteromonas sp.]RZD23039.1 hypothetical protein EVU92_13655 [Pseudoalteromonas sp. MEBiC 03485]